MSSSPAQNCQRLKRRNSSALLGIIRLYKRADEHMEVLSVKIEPLIRAGYSHIRGQKRGASASAVGGSSQTLRLHRPRMLQELTGTMGSRTIESTLDGWKTFADSDLSQHSLTKAVSKLAEEDA